MATELDELVAFLSSPSPQTRLLRFCWMRSFANLTLAHQIRKAALDIVQGLTGTDEGIQKLASRICQLVPPLLALLEDSELMPTRDLAQLAASSLVNLSQEPKLSDTMVKLGGVEKSMEVLSKAAQPTTRLCVMLLVNLTQSEAGASIVLKEGDEKLAGLFVSRLVRLFSRCSEYEAGGDDKYEHVPGMLVNITRLEAGRKLLLDTKRGLLKQILPQIDSRSLIRRKGVAGTVRNCCFEAESQLPNLLLASQFLWPALLLPLAGKQMYKAEDTSKMPPELATPLSLEREVEQDPQVRIEAAEAIYLIVQQEAGRRAFWSVNGPKILQAGYQDEEDAQVMAAFERLGSLLTRGIEDTQ